LWELLMSLGIKWLSAPVGALFALSGLAFVTPHGALAASLAAELGPQVSLAVPSGGYVGRLSVAPAHAPVGTPVTVTGQGFPSDQDFDLAWRTVNGSWKAGDGVYLGRDFQPAAYRIAAVRSDKAGNFTATFTTPEDFGFGHDIVLQQGDRLFTQTAFDTDMTVKLKSDHGPVGGPIEIEVNGIGWQALQGSWMLLYDNAYTGWMSSITTHGTARFTIPATGRVGPHILEVLNSDFGSIYRNPQQSPQPDRPLFKFRYTVTADAPVLPAPPERQLQTQVWSLPPAGELVTTPPFSPVDRPVVTVGAGFEPGKTYKLNWTSLTGNRIIGHWEEAQRVIAEAKADTSGRVEFHYNVPDDLGGNHTLWVDLGNDKRKVGAYWVAASALPLDVTSGPVGTQFTIHLKGTGWTETANIYTVVYDNGHTGYACGFNSQGDVQIFIQATGEPGWHFVDLYPAIYKGKETFPVSYRLPQLTYAKDHPAEDLPAFHFAFKVTGEGQRASTD
jgi:hypothetical protein